jgi:hypothetical protein
MGPSTRSGPRRNRYFRQHGSGTHHVHWQRTTQPKPAAATAAATWWDTGDVVTVSRDGATPARPAYQDATLDRLDALGRTGRGCFRAPGVVGDRLPAIARSPAPTRAIVH